MSNMVVQTNVLALNAHRNMKGVGGIQDKASQKLASGFRINSAADDAAGLAISEKMRSQIRGLDMASKNSQDAISLIQTAEGGMQEINNMVQRIRELVVYASNDTADANNGGVDPSPELSGLQSGDRQKIQDEINSLMKEIDSMAGRVEFNKKKLINGDFAPGNTPLGKGTALSNAYAASIATVTGASAAFVTISATHSSMNSNVTSAVASAVSAVLLLSAAGTDFAAASINAAISGISAVVTALSAATLDNVPADAYNTAMASINTIIDSLRLVPDNTAGDVASKITALEGWRDGAVMKSVGVNYAAKVTLQGEKTRLSDAHSDAVAARNLASDAYKTFSDVTPDWPTRENPAAGKIYFQVGPNANQGWTLNIGNITSQGLGLATGPIKEDGIRESTINGNIDPHNLVNVLKMTGEGDLTGLLDKIDAGLSIVTTERAKLGAAQNRLEYTIKSLDISSENLSASESRIRDTDMAKEMMNLTKANVLQQSTISILSQANQNPMSLLSLLR